MLEHLDKLEGNFQRLLAVEPWVAIRLVRSVKIIVNKATASADTLSHVVFTGHLEVNSTEPGAAIIVGTEGLQNFGENGVERPCFYPGIRRVPMPVGLSARLLVCVSLSIFRLTYCRAWGRTATRR